MIYCLLEVSARHNLFPHKNISNANVVIIIRCFTVIKLKRFSKFYKKSNLNLFLKTSPKTLKIKQPTLMFSYLLTNFLCFLMYFNL